MQNKHTQKRCHNRLRSRKPAVHRRNKNRQPVQCMYDFNTTFYGTPAGGTARSWGSDLSHTLTLNRCKLEQGQLPWNERSTCTSDRGSPSQAAAQLNTLDWNTLPLAEPGSV